MYKVTKRDCPMFGIGPYVCEFICDTASDITTLPTSISEGTGGRTVYDNQKCASGSIANVASGSESKQYMLNNQDIWCPYSVAAGSSSGGSSESSITVDFALSETSENPVANKVITAALNEKANTDTIPDLSPYAKKTDIPTELPANGGNADTVNSLRTFAMYQDIFSTTLTDTHPCWNKKCSVQGQSQNPNEDNYIENAPETNVPVWYEVETIGLGNRAYQIARGCFTHQRKNFIRYKHDDIWSDWKNIADGGNADTVDGLHADGFIKVNSHDGYDCNTLYDSGLYLCGEGATNTPNNLEYGTLFVMPYRRPYGNGIPDYCAQIFIPNGDAADASMWYRTSIQNAWNEWKRSCDGDNVAITGNLNVNGYITGSNASSSDHNHALLIGHDFQDYCDFFEYGGLFRFFKSQSGTDTLLGKITDNGWEGNVVGDVTGSINGWSIYNHINDNNFDADNAKSIGVYRINSEHGSNLPTANGYDIFVTNLGGYITQLAIADNATMYIRYYDLLSWNSWREVYTSGNKPYVTGSVSVSYSTESQTFEILDFTPSAVICKYSSRYENDGTTKWATPITNGFAVTVNSTEAKSMSYIAFK